MTERDFKKISDISKSLKNIIEDRSKAESILIWNAWKASVGHMIFSNTVIRAMEKGQLIVEVSDQSWKKALYEMEDDLVRKLNEWMGEEKIKEIVFL